MTRRRVLAGAGAALCWPVTAAKAGGLMIEDFTDGEAEAWRYVSDRVMGGVSDGTMQLVRQGADQFARLTGTVSTANNGGFIQMRRALDGALLEQGTGLRLRLRGNGARYFVHLRPSGSLRPWHYFAAEFETSGQWEEIVLPWSRFTAQGGLKATFDPARVTSIGLVAYGADYEALLDVAWVKVE
ncbi:CIA30 family protein [Pacificoceanicola onchidii]|uniref:CIA30 family protein n=1 Tax=Pacificoceanicola onchidii TaxID=2562685 RepID=UPI0014560F08|nr:CIA30 family protein [Pacificoceanicola onchidii]